MSILLVTLAIGDKYLEEYNRLFRKSQEEYAKKHGYDFMVITDYLDKTCQVKDAISFNKILVCSQPWSEKYEFIVFIDADILINPNAPAIHSQCINKKGIGIIDEYSQPSYENRLVIQKRMNWESTASEYYKLCNFEIKTQHVLNTGVLVMQPKKHRYMLDEIYTSYVGKSYNHPRGFHYEQSAIGYELLTRKRAEILPNTFNAVWGMYKIYNYINPHVDFNLSAFFKNNHFIHFAGKVDLEKVESLWGSVSHTYPST